MTQRLLGLRLARHSKGDVAQLQEEIISLRQQVARLAMRDATRIKQLTEAHAEAREVRSALRLGNRMKKIVLRAEIDALEMLKIYMAGLPTTRENAKSLLLLSRRRWNWAKALCRVAEIHGRWEFDVKEVVDGNEIVDTEKAARKLEKWSDYIITNERWDLLRDKVPR